MNYETALENIRNIVKKHINMFSENAYDITILPGWISIVENLLDKIQQEIDGTNGRIKIVQIKEKFGGLRFYFGSEGLDDVIVKRISAYVLEAMKLSESSCVICGEAGERMNDGYITVRCGNHQDLEQEIFKNYNFVSFVKHEDELAKLLGQR